MENIIDNSKKILSMLEADESIEFVASDIGTKPSNIKKILKENSISNQTILTTQRWRKSIHKILPQRILGDITWTESKESSNPYTLYAPIVSLSQMDKGNITVIPICALKKSTSPDVLGSDYTPIPWSVIANHLLSDAESNNPCTRFTLDCWEALNEVEKTSFGSIIDAKSTSKKRYIDKLDIIAMMGLVYGDINAISDARSKQLLGIV